MVLSIDHSQWLCSITALLETNIQQSKKESISSVFEPRSHGIEYLFRVGVQLQLSLSAILTASTYFHRFFTRFSNSEYPAYCVASASIFVASKSEECGRRLKDVAMVCMTKATSMGMIAPEDDLPELEKWQSVILKTEDILLESLGFDLAVQHPHAILSEIFMAQALSDRQDVIEDLTWSIATDSFRTPLCVLFDPAIISCASLAIAVSVVEGDAKPDLDCLLEQPSCSEVTDDESTPSSAALLQASLIRYKIPILKLKTAIAILIKFYRHQWLPSTTLAPGQDHFLAPIANIPLPKGVLEDLDLYKCETSP